MEKSSFHANRSWRLPHGPMVPRYVEHQQICSGSCVGCSFPLLGKIRGMAETICCCSFGLSPAWVMLMRLADQEKAKSLTFVEPRVVVNLATSILLGCDHESLTAGQFCSPHSPPSPYPCSGFSQDSLVKLIIKVVLLVMFKSPRTFSSRQFSGIPTCATQSCGAQRLLRFGAGSWERYARPAGLSWSEGMVLLANGAPVVGSFGTGGAPEP